MRGLFGPLDSCGFRVSKSGISFSSIRLWVALGAYIGAEVDESTMNPVDRPRAAPPPMGLPISDSPISPFHFVQTMGEAGVSWTLPGEPQGILRIEYFLDVGAPEGPGPSAGATEKPGRSRRGRDSESTRLDDCSDCSTEEGLSTYAKRRIFVCQVDTFAGVWSEAKRRVGAN
jgi:hypothetical protein